MTERAERTIQAKVAVPTDKVWELLNAGHWLSFRDNGNGYILGHIGLRATSEPIYVSRPSERVVSGGMVYFLPREYDHMPDAWTPPMLDGLWEGQCVELDAFRALLEAATPVGGSEEALTAIKKYAKEKLPQ